MLVGYSQRGKHFIPPLLQQFTFPKEASWIDNRLPELVWIALLMQIYGQPEGTRITVQVAEVAANFSGVDQLVFAVASDYEQLNPEQKNAMVEELRRRELLEQAGLALVALSENYPTHPMAFLSDGLSPSRSYWGTTLRDLKAVLREMYDRHSLLSILVQATVVEAVFKNASIVVSDSSRLANLAALSGYPHTRESTETAREVVAMVNGMLPQGEKPEWPGNFWNRGRILESCEE